MFNIPRIEWCGYVAGVKSNNFMLRKMVTLMREDVPELFKNCPWEGRSEITNSKLNTKLVAFLPKGIYRINNKITGEITKSTFSIFIEFETH